MKTSRRQVLASGMAAMAGMVAGSASAATVSPHPAKGDGVIAPQFRLSVAAYSFRDLLPQGGKPGSMTLHDFLDLAAVWRLDAVEPTSYYFSSEDPGYICSLKARAFKLGLDVSGTAIRDNLCLPPGEARDQEKAHVKKWVDHAALLGAPCIRIFAGNKAEGVEREQALAWAIEGMKECCDYAGSRGVFLAIENHGYLTETAADVLGILDAVKHEWLGINLDTGNFHENPYENIAQAAPAAIMVQVKVEMTAADGKSKEPADFPRIIQILRDANYRGYVALEYEAKEDPMAAVPIWLERLREATA